MGDGAFARKRKGCVGRDWEEMVLPFQANVSERLKLSQPIIDFNKTDLAARIAILGVAMFYLFNNSIEMQSDVFQI